MTRAKSIEKYHTAYLIYSISKILDPNMQYTRVREGEVKCVQKEMFSQEHTVNATCLMFFYAAMRRKKI